MEVEKGGDAEPRGMRELERPRMRNWRREL